MKAVVCTSFGPVAGLVVEDRPDPQPSPGEVVVSIEAAGVNFPDGLIVRGEYQMKPKLPFTPGSEVAGRVSAVGTDVSDCKVGDRVIALCVLGGMAEKVAVPVRQTFPIPESMSGAEASGFSLAYGTAIHALQDKGQLRSGETLLVLGAAGGVGMAAVQVGKAMGATVIAAASSDEKLDLARASGADHTVNYANGDLKSLLRNLAPGGVDVVLDPVGGTMTEAAVRNLHWGGRLLIVGFTQGEIPRLPVNLLLLKEAVAVGVFYGEFTNREPVRHHDNLGKLLAWYEEGKLRPHIGASYPLERAAEAINHVMDRRALGKIVLAIATEQDRT